MKDNIEKITTIKFIKEVRSNHLDNGYCDMKFIKKNYHWDSSDNYDLYECSYCRAEIEDYSCFWVYCPYCGSKIIKEWYK